MLTPYQYNLGMMAITCFVRIQAFTPIDLGTAAPFGIIATTAISNTGASVIVGELGLYPNTLASITGFPPGLSGTVHAADGVANQAHQDAQTAYDAAAALFETTDLSGQDLGGKTLVAGTYHFASSVGVTGPLALDGQNNPDAQFVFQIGSTLTTASASSVVLINGAKACNVFWQVGSSATLGTTANFVGNILASASITLNSGVTIIGGLYALTGAVTLINDQVTAQQNCDSQGSSMISVSSVTSVFSASTTISITSSSEATGIPATSSINAASTLLLTTSSATLTTSSFIAGSGGAGNVGAGSGGPVNGGSVNGGPANGGPESTGGANGGATNTGGNSGALNGGPGSGGASNGFGNGGTGADSAVTGGAGNGGAGNGAFGSVESTGIVSMSLSILAATGPSSNSATTTTGSSSTTVLSLISSVTRPSSTDNASSSIAVDESSASQYPVQTNSYPVSVSSSPAPSLNSTKLNATSAATNHTKVDFMPSMISVTSAASHTNSHQITPSPEIADSLEQTYPDVSNSSIRLKLVTHTSLGEVKTSTLTILCMTSTYYEKACSCTKTRIFPADSVRNVGFGLANDAITTINGTACKTSTYYEASCSCTKTTIVPVKATPTPQIEAGTKAVVIVSGVPYTISTYYERACRCMKTTTLPIEVAGASDDNLAATTVSAMPSVQTMQILVSCMAACMSPYMQTITTSIIATEICSATPRYRM